MPSGRCKRPTGAGQSSAVVVALVRLLCSKYTAPGSLFEGRIEGAKAFIERFAMNVELERRTNEVLERLTQLRDSL